MNETDLPDGMSYSETDRRTNLPSETVHGLGEVCRMPYSTLGVLEARRNVHHLLHHEGDEVEEGDHLLVISFTVKAT